MNYDIYLQAFQSALANIDSAKFNSQNIQLFTGIVLESVALKAYKPEWSGDPKNALTADSRIFFSVWVSDKTIKENRLYYNIHALRLRQLKGYAITSREFAERFRKQFKPHLKEWDNVSINYGPLTLMEGWKELQHETLSTDIATLADRFYTIAPIIDTMLRHYKVS